MDVRHAIGPPIRRGCLWRQPIGAGWSSFAVVGHFGVTQEQRGEDELITCYDIDNGKLHLGPSHAGPFRRHHRRRRPPLHAHDRRGNVYAMGAMGDLYCLDGATGKAHLASQRGQRERRRPAQVGQKLLAAGLREQVIVSAGGVDGKSLVAYDKIDRRAAVERRR